MTGKTTGRIIVQILGFLMLFLAVPMKAEASSGVIQFTTANSQIKKGDTFTVVCQVTSTEPFMDASFTIDYDADRLHFVKGGKKVSGDNGTLQVSSVGNSTATTKKTFSLQFAAAKNGSATIAVDGTAKVTDEEGNAFSISSNRLVVTVSKKGAGQAQAKPTEMPVVTPEPVLSKNNKLKSLKTTALSISPDFTGDGKDYIASVDCNTNTLYVTFEAEDDKARVQLVGNENLQTGQNNVQVVVTAEDGSKRAYNITVTKETKAETEARKNQENAGSKDISFRISKKNDSIFLENTYNFEVMDVSGLTSIPAGYVQSSIELNGISVPAFTMENDLDNNYLLLYLKGPAGVSSIYQFDREEKTLQRYTGSMIDKVNKSAGETRKPSGMALSNYILLGIIVALVIVILCMLIAMLKMAMKKKEEKKGLDDLDF